MPPITFPVWSPVVIVSDRFRSEMSKSGVGRFRFRHVVKDHIVKLQWEEWNRASSPLKYPKGEPEEYLSARNSAKAAEALGELWELVLRVGATVDAGVKFSPLGQLPLGRFWIRLADPLGIAIIFWEQNLMLCLQEFGFCF